MLFYQFSLFSSLTEWKTLLCTFHLLISFVWTPQKKKSNNAFITFTFSGLKKKDFCRWTWVLHNNILCICWPQYTVFVSFFAHLFCWIHQHKNNNKGKTNYFGFRVIFIRFFYTFSFAQHLYFVLFDFYRVTFVFFPFRNSFIVLKFTITSFYGCRLFMFFFFSLNLNQFYSRSL